jgi:succinate dehydrogenase flavin-adding protein (antitoxin of CptAB toxin-antitoxin module)
MKELDVLLENFVASNAAAIQAGQWPELESLLALEDDRLWDLLVSPGKCTRDEPLSLVLLISGSTRHVIADAH